MMFSWASRYKFGIFLFFIFVPQDVVAPGSYSPDVTLPATKSVQRLRFPSKTSDLYPNRADFTWKIRAPIGSLVLVVVKDISIEDSDTCEYNYLDIYDGYSASFHRLERLCGHSSPSKVVSSSSNLLFLRFTSDLSSRGRGFNLTYQEERPTMTGYDACYGETVSITATGSSNYVISPGYPNKYPSDVTCRWEISSTKNRVKLTVESLNLEIDDTYCRFDHVEIFDGMDSNSNRITKLCSLPYTMEGRTFYSTSPHVFIRFTSDIYYAGNGFKIGYSAYDDCQGDPISLTATDNDKYVISPGYPIAYPSDANCRWKIVSTKAIVMLTMESLNLEIGDTYCQNDYVEIFDGIDSNTFRITKLCSLPDTIDGRFFYSTSPYVFIRLTSNRNNEGSGFKIAYSAGVVTDDSSFDPSSSSNSSVHIGIIIGGIAAGICLIFLVFILIYGLKRRRQSQRQANGAQRSHGNGNRQWNGPNHPVYVINSANASTMSSGPFASEPPPYSALNHAYIPDEAPPSYDVAHKFTVQPPEYSNATLTSPSDQSSSANNWPLTGEEVIATTEAALRQTEDHVYANQPVHSPTVATDT